MCCLFLHSFSLCNWPLGCWISTQINENWIELLTTGTHSAGLCGPLLQTLFPQVDYSYNLALEQLKLHALHKRRYHLNVLFISQVYRGTKLCPSVLETVGLRIPGRYIRDFSMFVSVLLVKIVLLLDALQQLTLSVRAQIFLEPKHCYWSIFYNFLPLVYVIYCTWIPYRSYRFVFCGCVSFLLCF
jgi:hypothetical protein